MKNLRLTLQFGIALTISFALILLVTAIALRNFNTFDGLHQEAAQQVQLADDVTSGYSLLRQVRLSALRAAIAGRDSSPERQQEILQSATEMLQQAQQLFSSYLERPDPAEAALATDKRLRTALNNYLNLMIKPSFNFARTMNFSRLDTLMIQAEPYDEALASAMKDVHGASNQRIVEINQQLSTTLFTSMIAMAASLLCALLIAVATFVALRRSVVAPLARAQEHFERIAQGDLSRPIETLGRNEIGRLYTALSNMQAMLIGDISQVRESAQTIHHGAREIAQGNTDFSSRTEQQAAALEQTASSMEQMTSTVRQNAANADEARTLSQQATTIAERGGEEMQQVVDGMQDIAKTAGQITSITAIIDGIAFQTNILALNASVEAARAGEHGRGFAVVAGEVRNLATRSADAAGEIKKLIESASGKIESGSQTALNAGRTMQEVVNGVREVNQLISEIAAASKEQSDGIEQVNQAVGEIDSVTQQSAALIEQAAAAAASLEHQAGELNEIVERFCLEQPTPPAQLAPSPALPATAPPAEPKLPALENTPASGKALAAGPAARNSGPVAKRDTVAEWAEF